MVTALEKAYSRSSALMATVHTRALDLKAAGVLGAMVTPAMMTGISDWQGSSKARESYAYFRSWVYAAINAIASEAAIQPVNVGKVKADESETEKRRTPGRTKAHLLERMTDNIQRKAADKEVEVIADHPLLKILERPNPIQYKYQFVYTVVANLNLTGRAYIIRDEGENGDEFYALPTSWVRPDHKDGPFSKFFVVNPRDMDYSRMQKPLDVSQVAMIHLPNPADLMGAISPAQSMSAAIRVDDRIQTCQEKFFDNGIFPSVIVTVGKDPHPDVPGGIRPRLTGTQRRQVTGAIRRVMGGVANFGNPAIVDGLIESIAPLSRTQTELGWDKSEEKLKMRILSAFCVHPFILGEPVGVGGYAQTYNIEKRFCSRVNVFLDIMSTVMTYFIGQKKEKKEKAKSEASNEKLVVWWDKVKPHDPSLDDANWKFARTNGDVSCDEFRARKLGLSPDETKQEAAINLTLLSGITGVLTAVGTGAVRPEQAAVLFEGVGVPAELAAKIAGVGMEQDNLEQASGALEEAVKALRKEQLMLTSDVLEAVG